MYAYQSLILLIAFTATSQKKHLQHAGIVVLLCCDSATHLHLDFHRTEICVMLLHYFYEYYNSSNPNLTLI